MQCNNLHQTASHILPIHSYLSFPYPRKTGSNDAERTPWNKNAPDLSNPYTSDWLSFYCTLDVDITILHVPFEKLSLYKYNNIETNQFRGV